MTGTPLGTTLSGRYRLDARIGRGGMSTVYRAFDTVLEREVAIKLMHRDIASDSDNLERFRREARAVAQLSHAHIVTVIDAGEWEGDGGASGGAGHDEAGGGGHDETGGGGHDEAGGGGHDETGGAEPGAGGVATATPYIVLEHVAGETLKDLIRREAPLDVPTALAYGIEIARALGAAHAHGIVHRDVKPQNVLLSPEGGAKITDFGIARTLAEEGLTLDGRVLGTTDYVSPEQALGRDVTGQSDVYSLGVVLYEMLTGSVPFRGDSPVAVAMMHVREEVPDVQLARPDVSAATASVVERATARELDRRYPDMASTVAGLEAALAIETARAGQATGEVTTVLRTLPPPARRVLPWRVRHPARWAGSLTLLAAIAAIAVVAALGNTHRGTGVAPGARAGAGKTPVVLAAKAATSYNPFGTGPEHAEAVASVVDGDINTAWSTEHYIEGSLGKPGLGVALDAAPGVVARAVEIQTPTPGFAVAIYAATHPQLLSAASASASATAPAGSESAGAQVAEAAGGASGSLSALGWVQLAPPRTAGARTTIPVNASGHVYRYYLIWIVRLPPGEHTAAISEATLFR